MLIALRQKRTCSCVARLAQYTRWSIWIDGVLESAAERRPEQRLRFLMNGERWIRDTFAWRCLR
jgi:hypothetical protein